MALMADSNKHGDENEQIEPGDLVWHKLTGDGPWIAIQDTMMRTSYRVLNGRQKVGTDGEAEATIEDAWIVETPNGRLGVPAVALKRKRRWLRGRTVKDGLLAVALTLAICVVCPIALWITMAAIRK